MTPSLHAQPPIKIRRGAVFDRSRRYRYLLTRRWDDRLPLLAMVLLNPSTADHRRDDPTIRRCIDFALRWRFGSLHVVNLFAFRATDPDDLVAHPHPVGPRNDRWIAHAARHAHAVVAAWGNHGLHLHRAHHVLALHDLRQHPRLQHLGLTQRLQPRHPLYLRATTTPQPYQPAPVSSLHAAAARSTPSSPVRTPRPSITIGPR